MNRAALIAAAVLLAVVVWIPLSAALTSLPGPLDVIRALLVNVTTSDTYYDVGLTLRRIAIGFVGAMIVGSLIGVVAASRDWAEALLVPWVAVLLAIPGPVYITIAVLIGGINETSTLVALIVSVVPFVANLVFQGVRATDQNLASLARFYRFGFAQRLRHVLVPQIGPSLLASARTGFALTWKEVVILEALSQERGIGAQIVREFKLLNTADVIAWTLLFTVITIAIELAVFRPWEARTSRWRHA